MDWCPIQYVFLILGQISTIKKVHLSVYLSICLSVYLSIPKIPGIGSRYTVTLISIQSFVHLFWPFVHLSSVHTIDGLLVTTISLSHTHTEGNWELWQVVGEWLMGDKFPSGSSCRTSLVLMIIPAWAYMSPQPHPSHTWHSVSLPDC